MLRVRFSAAELRLGFCVCEFFGRLAVFFTFPAALSVVEAFFEAFSDFEVSAFRELSEALSAADPVAAAEGCAVVSAAPSVGVSGIGSALAAGGCGVF